MPSPDITYTMKFVRMLFAVLFHICICLEHCVAGEDTIFEKNIRLHCVMYPVDGDGSQSSSFQSDLNLACQLRFRDGKVFSLPIGHDTKKNTSIHFTTYVSNSTLKKVYHWSRPSSVKGSWEIVVRRQDFFEEYSDWKLPKLYPVLPLKWRLVTELCSPILARCYTHTSVLSYFGEGRPWIRTKRGNINIGPDLAAEDYQTISLQFPCQPSSRMMIVSSQVKTLVYASWDAFKPGSQVVYDVSCDLQGLSTCGNSSIVHNAVIAHNKLLLVTSIGLVSTNTIPTRCWWNNSLPGCEIKYSRVSLPFAGEVDWSASKLSYSPLCVIMDHLSVEDEVVVLKLAHGSSSFVLISAAPYEEWSNAGMQELSAESIIEYSAQTKSMIVVGKDMENQQYFVASYDNHTDNSSSTTQSIDKWIFNDFTPSRAVLLSNKFFYLAGRSAILCSVDGGIFFVKISELADDEDVVDIAVHDMRKSVGFLTSEGRILITRIGVGEVTELQPLVDGILHILYDDVGRMYALKLVDTGGSTLRVVVEKVMDRESGPCSFKLEPSDYIYTQSLVHVDIGSTYYFDITGSTSRSNGSDSILSVTIANPSIMRVETERNVITPYLERLVIVVHSMTSRRGMSTITVAFTDAEPTCAQTSFTLTVSFSCPPQKHLRFDYSSFVPPSDLLNMEEYVNETRANPMLQTLPPNYRPPSSIAVAIPLSKNVYNFYPEKESQTGLLEYEFAEKFAISEYCTGKEMRKACSCNSALKYSSLEAHSDCREKVYHVKYGTEYYINISIVHGSEGSRDFFGLEDHYVYLEEVNGRTSDVYQVTERQGEVCSEVQPGNCFVYENPTTDKRKISGRTRNFMSHHTGQNIYNLTTLQIKFLGTGLFHFRIVLANGFSHCRLQDEFQVYVTNAPLPFPVGTIIRLTVSVIVGGALAGIYMYSLASGLPHITTKNKTDAPDEPNAQQPQRRNDASFAMENDVTALRQKIRASFKTTNKLAVP